MTALEAILKFPGVVPYMTMKLSFLESSMVMKDQVIVIVV